jgi:hypothetical protein
MNFSQKRSCKGCKLDESECNVKKVEGPIIGAFLGAPMRARIPTEPCFKPLTRKEYRSFDISVQNANLEIFRAQNLVQTHGEKQFK